jgi:hypothetical protein
MTVKGELTSKESLAIDLLLEALGEERCDRTADEYKAIVDKIRRQPLKVLDCWVMSRLRHYNLKFAEDKKQGHAFPEICYFRSGDRYPRYEKFPESLSVETLRSALLKWGVPMRRPRKRVTKGTI